MLCINCSKPLMIASDEYISKCECGINYSTVLLLEMAANIDKQIEWNIVRKHRFFEISEGKAVTVFRIGNEFVHPDVYKLHHEYLKPDRR